jgi:seryl-tRNA synthetase
MLDIRLIRESPDAVRANLARRRVPEKLEHLERVIAKDAEWRRDLQEMQDLRHRRNAVSQEIGKAVKEGRDPATLKAEAAALPERIKALETRVDALRAEVDDGLLRLPNLLHESVPDGAGPEDNVEVRRWGEPKAPSFPMKPHGELAEALGIADFERARKVAGAGFVYLLGDLVRLDQALLAFTLDLLVKRGYTPVFPPFILRRSAYQGVVDLKDFQDVMYKIEGEDAYLIATSEHPLVAMYQDEILDEARLPLRYCGIATQFRKEIGAHGVDTKGLFRMHQFNKIEQVIFARPEDSWTLHEELRANLEAVFEALGIPHRTIVLCSADTGNVMAKTYDVEAWFPRQNAYREVGSCSNAVDFQARRLGIRVGKSGGEKRLVHTLNSTAVATSRAMTAILENFQNEDGTVTVPKVLRPFMGAVERIGAPR